MDTVALLVDNEQLQKKVKELELDKARLREALLKIHNNGATWAGQTMAREALASTDSSNWLQERKAQWRREVLEEAAIISMQVYGGLPTEEELKER